MNDGDPLAALVDGTSDDRVILVVDQLEEMFTACGDEHERAAFADALAALADDPDRHVVVVLAIRADFYGRCAGYRALSAYMSANNVLVGPMRREELRRAIELPARRAGLRVEPRLVSALIGDVAEEPGGLPLLSTALVELWEERSGRTLGHTSYERSGGVNGAVARLAERAYQRLSPNERRRARAMLLRLTDADQAVPVRRRVQLAELDAETDDETARVLAVLTENRLVTVDEGTAEVAHEALLREWPRLRAWLEEDIEGRRLHQHLTHAAGEWADAGRDPAELYRGTRLGAALDWAAGHDHEPNELEREFLAASKVASEQEAERQLRTNRRLRALLAGAGVLLAAAVVAGAGRHLRTAERAQRGPGRDRAATGRRGGQRTPARPGAAARHCRRRAGRLRRDAVEPVLGTGAKPRDAGRHGGPGRRAVGARGESRRTRPSPSAIREAGCSCSTPRRGSASASIRRRAAP